MSAEKQSLILTYTPLQGGDGESRWIRLEQERPEDESLTLDEAAEIIDSLYEIEPCDDGMGGGGEEADPENEPEEEEFDEAMAEMLRRAGICKQPEYWETIVRVYRSHKRPGYVLRSETAEVRATEPVRESHRQVVEASGAVIELEMPYDGDLTGIPAGVKWTVRGSTVNLDRPLAGRLALRYVTYYERVTLRIPTRERGQWRDALGMATGSPFDISGGGSSRETPTRAELPAASVVAFWADIAASCDLEPPPVDEDVDEATIREICGKEDDEHEPGGGEPGGCWKTVVHYDRCNCSYSRVNEWEEEVSAPCDGAAAGSRVGREERFGGFVGCPEDGDEELQDPEYYKKRCCKPPPKPLPRCRQTYAVYSGGHEIEYGPDYWKGLYGENVSMIAVTPQDGPCGELITTWNVPQRNCCDDVEPLKTSSLNPEEIRPGREYLIAVVDGKPGAELEWSAYGGIRFKKNGGARITTTDQAVWIEVDDNTCPEARITVDDGCFPVTMRFRAPESDPPKLSATDLAIAPESVFSISAAGGVPPYMWQASGGLTLIGWSPTGATAYFRAGKRDEWCTATVTVVDQCGREATCTVRNAETGVWRLVPRNTYDRCSPPGAPFPYNGSATSGVSEGYYIVFSTAHGQKSSCSDTSGWGCPPGTNVMSEDVFPDGQTFSEYCANSAGSAYTAEYQDMCCITRWKYGSLTYYHPFVNYAFDLYKWICE